MFNKKNVYDAILKPKQERQFTVGTVYSLEPFKVILDGDTVAIPCQSLTGLLGLDTGRRVVLLRYGKQFISVGVIGDRVDITQTIDDHLSGSYFYRETLYFTSSGDFKKADFPWLRAIRVKCQGAGGAGGSIQNGTGVSGAGSGGGYAESFIADIESLPDTVQVTVGAGGTTVTGGDGNPGGDSSFGSIVEATGGGGGGSNGSTSAPGAGTGDFTINGGWGTPGGSGTDFPGGVGGSSYMGNGGSGRRHGSSGNGSVGRGYGGGGGGCRRGSSGTAEGGAGANGIVIVDLFG